MNQGCPNSSEVDPIYDKSEIGSQKKLIGSWKSEIGSQQK